MRKKATKLVLVYVEQALISHEPWGYLDFCSIIKVLYQILLELTIKGGTAGSKEAIGDYKYRRCFDKERVTIQRVSYYIIIKVFSRVAQISDFFEPLEPKCYTNKL